jgi:hypothetical protein
MPENLSSILDATEPTVLTTGWGRPAGPLWHAGGMSSYSRSKYWGLGFREDSVPPERGIPGRRREHD